MVLDAADSWLRWLSGEGSCGSGGSGPSSATGRPQVAWERAHVWGALKTLVCDVLGAEALEAAAAQLPALLPAVLATAAALPGAGVPPRERTHALMCLAPLLRTLKGAVWSAAAASGLEWGGAGGPEACISALRGVTWAHVTDVPLLKALVPAVTELAESALRCAAAAAGGGGGSGGMVNGTEARRAQLGALRHLVLDVPGSSAPPLVQAAALEAGLQLAVDALSGGTAGGGGERAPELAAGDRGSGATAQLWGWRAAAAAGAPAAAQLGGVQLGGCGPAVVARVEQQAADLLVTALQVCALGGLGIGWLGG